MSFEVRTIAHFDKRFKKLSKKYKSLKKDFIDFTEQLKENPRAGADLVNGIRKVRMAISDKGKGKSGGARIITYTVEIDEGERNDNPAHHLRQERTGLHIAQGDRHAAGGDMNLAPSSPLETGTQAFGGLKGDRGLRHGGRRSPHLYI